MLYELEGQVGEATFGVGPDLRLEQPPPCWRLGEREEPQVALRSLPYVLRRVVESVDLQVAREDDVVHLVLRVEREFDADLAPHGAPTAIAPDEVAATDLFGATVRALDRDCDSFVVLGEAEELRGEFNRCAMSSQLLSEDFLGPPLRDPGQKAVGLVG